MIKRALIALSLVLVGSFGMAATTSQPALACSEGRILSLRPWYHGLTDGNCEIQDIESVGGLGPFLWRIALNLIEDIFQLAGYIAAGYVIYGGFLFMTSTGLPDRAARGRKTVINALVGLVIVIASVGIVNWVRGAIF